MGSLKPALTQSRDEEGFAISWDISLPDSASDNSRLPLIKVEQKGKSCWIPPGDFANGGKVAKQNLIAQGFKFYNPGQLREIIADAERVNEFPMRDIIGVTGHSGYDFGYPDGPITHDNRAVPTAYRTDLVNVSARGTFKEYEHGLREVVVDQYLPVCSLLFGLSAVLVSLSDIDCNYTIMFTGGSRKARQVLTHLPAALCGPVKGAAPGDRYLRVANGPLKALDSLLFQYNDMPLVYDGVGTFGDRRSSRNDVKVLMAAVSGADDAPWLASSGSGDRPRTIILCTSEKSLRGMLGQESPDTIGAASSAITESPLPEGEEGLINAPGAVFADADAHMDEILQFAANQYGTAMRVFICKLVKFRVNNKDNFRRCLLKHMDHFADLPEVAKMEPISNHHLDVFCLAYATGLLAQRFGVLPKEIDCKAVVLHCLSLHVGRRVEADPLEKVLSWLEKQKIIDLRDGRLRDMSNPALAERGVFLGECKGEAQLWIHPTRFRRAFEDDSVVLKQLKGRKLLKPDGSGAEGHNTRKCAIRSNRKSDRVYVIRVDDLEHWLEERDMIKPRRRR